MAPIEAASGARDGARPRLVHWLLALLILIVLRMIVPVIAMFY